MTEESHAADTQPPAKIDTTVPHSARIWNYWLGGKDNFAVDRAAGDQFRSTYPAVVDLARETRQFLIRAVTYLADEVGIRQFLDIGTGLPTADNTHEVAQRIAPESRVVYVDNDPLVLTHARALLVGAPEGVTDYIDADLRDPARVLAAAAGTLDLSRPVGLIFCGILGHVADTDEARSIVRRLLDPLVPGSHLVLTDGVAIEQDSQSDKAQEEYADSGAIPYRNRSLEEIASFFAGLQMVEPGLVTTPYWRPGPGARPRDIDGVAGIGVKP